MAKAILNGNEIFGNVHMGGGGGITPTKILSDGVISTTSAYATATFSDISDYDYIVIVFKLDDVETKQRVAFKVSDLSSSDTTFYVNIHRYVEGAVSLTSIKAVNYSGSYRDIKCDIYAYNENIEGGNS